MSFERTQSISNPRSMTYIEPETLNRFKQMMMDDKFKVQTYNPLPQIRTENLNGSTKTREESNAMDDIDSAASDYYQQLLQRLAKQNNSAVIGNFTTSPRGPVLRSGAIGASWRHVKQCTGNLGNHICFIDGVVKENDCRSFPPHGYSGGPTMSYQNVVERTPSGYLSSRISSNTGLRRATTSRNTVFQNHARNNFKYWYEPRKSNNKCIPTSIEGRIMKNGTAY